MNINKKSLLMKTPKQLLIIESHAQEVKLSYLNILAQALSFLSIKLSLIAANFKYLSTPSNSLERKGERLRRGRSIAHTFAEA